MSPIFFQFFEYHPSFDKMIASLFFRSELNFQQ